MAKLKKQEIIREYLFSDYFMNTEDEITTDAILQKIHLLADNGLAWMEEGNVYVGYELSFDLINVACKYAIKKNKKLKKAIIKADAEEKDERFAETNKEVSKISKIIFGPGTYFVDLNSKKKRYMIIRIEYIQSNRTNRIDTDGVRYQIYFIGKGADKVKDKLFDQLAYYKKLRRDSADQIIYYSDGTPESYTKFKSFDQLVMKGKDGVIDYIDHWVKNIPMYYNKYNMIPKLSILLYGEPGTGKSTFYRSVADYLKINEVCVVNPSYFMNNMNDENMSSSRRGGGRRIRTSKGIVPTLIAIDDIDAVCQSREDDKSAQNTSIVSNLLTFLDNPPTFYFKADDGVKYPVSMVVATTNYIDRLDDAIKRYGRFDLKIPMDRFGISEAKEMCDIYDLKLEDVVGKYDKEFNISPSELQAKCMEKVDSTLKNK